MYNLRSCKEAHELHYELLLMFTQFLDDGEIHAIRETFQTMDEDNSGDIEVTELREVYEHLNEQIRAIQEAEDELLTDE